MVVTTELQDGRVLAAKASQLGKWASKSALEKRLGAYEVPEKNLETPRKQAQKNYESAVREQRAFGNEIQNSHVTVEKSSESRRETRATERAAARKALADRFERERKDGDKELRQQQRTALRERHHDERKALKATLTEQRRQLFRIAKSAHRWVTPIELALHARERAMQLEMLHKRQHGERVALSRSFSTRAATWRAWLELQASQGDADAQAALRGIRYQEQRRKKQQANAIAGVVEEEEQQIQVLTVASLKAEIDRRLQWVVYKSTDGITRLIDQGHRIVVKDTNDDTLEAALRVAAAKYGNQITITGTAEFRQRAARMAVQLGIGVVDDDLQGAVQDEHEKRAASRRRLDPRGRER
jgi:hypothetical protein